MDAHFGFTNAFGYIESISLRLQEVLLLRALHPELLIKVPYHIVTGAGTAIQAT